MEITDEMVEVAISTYPIYARTNPVLRQQIRTWLTAVAPLIAKAENEACAKVAARFERGHGDTEWNGRWNAAIGDIVGDIRARHP